MKGFDNMKKLKLRKWVKVFMTIILLIIIGYILAHLLYSNILRINKSAEKCDLEKGYTCSYYEVQKYIKTGVSNG